MEGNIMALVKMFLIALGVALIVSVAVFMFQISQVNNFKQYVNYQIERNGGLTNEAISSIDNYSNEHYTGRFKVFSPYLYEKQPYGSIIPYEITGSFTFLFFEFEDVELPAKGSAISLVR
ncbi:hypothetical protein BTS2_3359 [Bacillus sp. TS-2]|nr:hypothetical protein BTS2_3359 [Bacillus sp. TS-2]